MTGQTTATEEEIAAAEEKQLVYTPTTPEGHYASRDGSAEPPGQGAVRRNWIGGLGRDMVQKTSQSVLGRSP